MLKKGLRAVISTNRTTITPKVAKKLKEVGISLDAGSEEKHNKFRGVKGSFKKALRGAINSKKAVANSLGYICMRKKDNPNSVRKKLAQKNVCYILLN